MIRFDEKAAKPAPVTVYDVAQDAVTSRRASFPAEVVHICRSGELRITLSRVGEEIYMSAAGSDPLKAEQTRVAFLSPTSGWTFSLSTWGYKRWVERCEKIG